MAGGAAARLAQLSKQLGNLDKTLVATAAGRVALALQKQVAQDTGGDGVLSGFKGRRAKLGVTVKQNGASASVAASPAGQWSILNSGARRHDIVAHGRPLATPWGPRQRVSGVSSPAKRTWDKASEVGVADAVRAVQAEFHRAVS